MKVSKMSGLQKDKYSPILWSILDQLYQIQNLSSRHLNKLLLKMMNLTLTEVNLQSRSKIQLLRSVNSLLKYHQDGLLPRDPLRRVKHRKNKRRMSLSQESSQKPLSQLLLAELDLPPPEMLHSQKNLSLNQSNAQKLRQTET